MEAPKIDSLLITYIDLNLGNFILNNLKCHMSFIRKLFYTVYSLFFV